MESTPIRCVYINRFNVNRFNINTRLFSRSYSTSTRPSDKPLPIKVLSKLDKDSIDSCRSLLRNKGGIYSFVNTVDQ